MASIVPKPNPHAKLGQGGRFQAVRQSVAKNSKVRDPDAVTAAIGRKKWGAAKFTKLSSAGRRAAV